MDSLGLDGLVGLAYPALSAAGTVSLPFTVSLSSTVEMLELRLSPISSLTRPSFLKTSLRSDYLPYRARAPWTWVISIPTVILEPQSTIQLPLIQIMDATPIIKLPIVSCRSSVWTAPSHLLIYLPRSCRKREWSASASHQQLLYYRLWLNVDHGT